MPECSERERKMLDNISKADVVLLYFDENHSTLSWMKNLTGKAPASYEVDYGHLDGERCVRRIKVTMGVTQKRWNELVKRHGQTDALAEKREPGGSAAV